MIIGYCFTENPGAANRYYHADCLAAARLVPSGFRIATFAKVAIKDGMCRIGLRGILSPLHDTDRKDARLSLAEKCYRCALLLGNPVPEWSIRTGWLVGNSSVATAHTSYAGYGFTTVVYRDWDTKPDWGIMPYTLIIYTDCFLRGCEVSSVRDTKLVPSLVADGPIDTHSLYGTVRDQIRRCLDMVASREAESVPRYPIGYDALGIVD